MPTAVVATARETAAAGMIVVKVVTQTHVKTNRATSSGDARVTPDRPPPACQPWGNLLPRTAVMTTTVVVEDVTR